MRKLRKLLALPPGRVGSLFMATALLALARWKHAHQSISELIEEIKLPINLNGRVNAEYAATVAWALRTAATVVPWRADCLVCAIAARNWAEKLGLPFEFHLGVSLGSTGELEAHAWSLSGTTFLSGNIREISRFREFDFEQFSAFKLKFSE